MFFVLKQLSSIYGKNLSGSFAALIPTINANPLVCQVRGAAKKTAGSCRQQNHNRKRKGKRYGPKFLFDQLVQPGQILFRQKGFRMHPGRNVDYGKDHTLYALREGHVKVTKELVHRPPWCSYGEGPYFERTFVHVAERPKVRKLVCLNPESLKHLLI
ncbi:large ribosomal subunit protein bL27m-like isoform X1 [Hydra vulgaris]|uniref:Large ribosomal subunit protein bL27m-like isoform X1 n=1 Tax=Hydra vulgaris TaxID=6087 RepID=A0ABM4BVS6_HYDVU